jgi:hypothetical protein
MHRTDRDEFLDGVGVPPGWLRPGVRVIVPVGTVNSVVNGGPSIAAIGVALQPGDRDGCWWFDVYTGGLEPLPQQYPVEQLLGIPAHGMTVPGLPAEESAGSAPVTP